MERSLKAVRSILVVEDDKMLREALEFYLDEYAEVDSAADRREAEAKALARVKQGRIPYNLLLIDINLLNGEDGKACLAALRRVSSCAQVPALAMTGYPANRTLTAACDQAGFFAVLEKPFLVAEMEAVLCAEGLTLLSRRSYEPAA